MQIFYPMVISAVAVLATLVYASYLDIRDRRVPFINWLPMLGVGLVCTTVLLWQKTGNASLIAGFIGLVVSFLYADYLDNRGRTDSSGLTGYYAESRIFPYLAIVLLLPVLSWFVLAPVRTFQLAPWYAMFAGILSYISYMEYKGWPTNPGRKKRKKAAEPESDVQTALTRWYFVIVVIIISIASYYMIAIGSWKFNDGLFIILPAIFSLVFYVFGRMHLFGGADAWALIFISFAVPLFPFSPLLNTPPLQFLAFSVLINALILNLVAPIAIFFINIVRGNRASLMYMFFGFPVSGDKIAESWGFVMEDFEEKDGKVSRKFIGFFDSLRRMISGEGRVYTKDLREHPLNYPKELALYKKAGTVWISYAVPFIVPITAGLITAIVFGDFLLAIMKIVIGGP